MESLQDADEGPKKRSKEDDMRECLLELKEMESKEKKDVREQEAAARAREREEDITFFLKLAEVFGKHFSESQVG